VVATVLLVRCADDLVARSGVVMRSHAATHSTPESRTAVSNPRALHPDADHAEVNRSLEETFASRRPLDLAPGKRATLPAQCRLP